MLAIHFAGGGHNDALVMALVVGALLLAARRRPAASGVAWAAAIGVKWFPLLFLPLHVLEARRSGRSVRYAALAGVAFLIAGLAFWRYGSAWLDSAANVSGQLRRTTSLSTARWLTGLGLSEEVAIALLGVLFVAGTLDAAGGVARAREARAVRGAPAGDDVVARSLVRGVDGAACRRRGGHGCLGAGGGADSYLVRGAVPL